MESFFDYQQGVHIIKYPLSQSFQEAFTPALFLDRDGVIIEDCHYISDPNDVKILNGASVLIQLANQKKYKVVVITNQSGIARKKFKWTSYEQVHKKMNSLLVSENANLSLVLACPFHKEAIDKNYKHISHPMRKPNPGMVKLAASYLNIDLSRSLMIGDKVCDIACAQAAGIKKTVHVLTGHGRAHRSKLSYLESKDFKVHLADSLADIPLRYLLSNL